MSNDDYFKKYDIIPPDKRIERREEQLPDALVPPAPLGSTYLGRVKWRSIEKLLRAYDAAVDAAKSVQHSLARLEEARHERERMLRLLEGAESIHAADADERERKRMQARQELVKARDELEEAEFAYERRARERERKRRPLETHSDPGGAEKPWMERLSEARARVEAVREVRDWFESWRAEEIRKAGGEDRLSERQRQALEDLEMAVNDEITKIRTGGEG